MGVLLATAPRDKPVAASLAWNYERAERRLDSASELASASKSPALLKVSERSANARTLFGEPCSPVRQIGATTIEPENPRR